MLDGDIIPVGVVVRTCTYALSHSEHYFKDPFTFNPDRFLGSSIITSDNLDAFAPFSIGPRSCLAKPLAYLELMLCTAYLVWSLDFEAVGSTGCGGVSMGKGREREEEFQIVDIFSSNKTWPVLRFKRRDCCD